MTLFELVTNYFKDEDHIKEIAKTSHPDISGVYELIVNYHALRFT